MERMTGIDPMFIYSDTPETPMEIAYVCVFDPSTAEGGYTFERVRDHLEERIPEMTPFRRRLMPVPLGLDHPRWAARPSSRRWWRPSWGGRCCRDSRRGRCT